MSTVVRDTRRGWLMLAYSVAAYLTFLVAQVLTVVPFALGPRHGDAGGRIPGAVLVFGLVVSAVAAGVVVVTGAVHLGRGNLRERLRSELSVRWRLRDVGLGLALGFGGLFLTWPASVLWALAVGDNHANSAVGEVFGGQRLHLGWALTLFFAVFLISPVYEEMLFRGVLWRAMEYWRWNRWVILGLTTVLFSFAHFELLRTPLLVVITLPIALARLLTRNLLASIVAHQMNNFPAAVVLLLSTQGVLLG
jgi:membrane protease YdiL (CAAX protease family)